MPGLLDQVQVGGGERVGAGDEAEVVEMRSPSQRQSVEPTRYQSKCQRSSVRSMRCQPKYQAVGEESVRFQSKGQKRREVREVNGVPVQVHGVPLRPRSETVVRLVGGVWRRSRTQCQTR